MESTYIKKFIGVTLLVIGIIILIPGLYFILSGQPEYSVYSAPSVIFLSIGGRNIRDYLLEKRKL